MAASRRNKILGDAIASRGPFWRPVVAGEYRQVVREDVEAAVPSPAMPIALVGADERRLPEQHPGLSARCLHELHGHDALEAIIGVDVGEAQTARLIQFKVMPRDDVAVPRAAAHAPPPFAADPEVAFALDQRKALRPVPTHHVLGVAPQPPDQFARRVEGAVDLEDQRRLLGGGLIAWHRNPPSAARRGRHPSGRTHPASAAGSAPPSPPPRPAAPH